jgi:uncharacterized protein with GYD domain
MVLAGDKWLPRGKRGRRPPSGSIVNQAAARTVTPRVPQSNTDRFEEVDNEIVDFGCKLDRYAMPGSYGFVTFIEAPDNGTAARLSIDLGSRGSVSITKRRRSRLRSCTPNYATQEHGQILRERK